MKTSQATAVDFETLAKELPADYQEKAYEFKAFMRARKIKSPKQLLQTIMAYCGFDWSTRNCAGAIAHRQGYVSDTAVKKRLTACIPWVKWLLAESLGVKKALQTNGLRFIVIDGSTIQAPGAKGISYRLHLAIELLTSAVHEATITTDKIGESLARYTLEPDWVFMADRGYNEPKVTVPFIQAGGHVILRYNSYGMRLHTRNEGCLPQDESAQNKEAPEVKIDWEERISQLSGDQACIPVTLKHGKDKVAGFVHAWRLPRAQAKQARKAAKKRAQKKGNRLSQKTLFLKEWILIFTTVSPSLLDTDTIMELYRVRWQIELVIKRLKSILCINKLRARKGGALADLYLHGKLLYALIIEKMAQRLFPAAKTALDAARELTPWRLWVMAKNVFITALMSCFSPNDRYGKEALRSLRERKRKRQLQRLSDDVLALLLTPEKPCLSAI